MTSIESLIENTMYKMKVLGIADDIAATNFSAHVGWSIALAMMALRWWGNKGLYIVTTLFTVESICWKLFTWHYWTYFMTGHMRVDWWNDLVINLVSRLAIPIGMCIYCYVRSSNNNE